jgi:hypothetical protein
MKKYCFTFRFISCWERWFIFVSDGFVSVLTMRTMILMTVILVRIKCGLFCIKNSNVILTTENDIHRPHPIIPGQLTSFQKVILFLNITKFQWDTFQTNEAIQKKKSVWWMDVFFPLKWSTYRIQRSPRCTVVKCNISPLMNHLYFQFEIQTATQTKYNWVLSNLSCNSFDFSKEFIPYRIIVSLIKRISSHVQFNGVWKFCGRMSTSMKNGEM